jgi:homoserine kinase
VKQVKAFAPASMGNVSLGFDILGAAVKPIKGEPLGDSVVLTEANHFDLTVSGRFAEKLPAEKQQNIVTHCYRHYVEQLQYLNRENIQPAHITLEKNLPIGSGLGSSAASIVAAFVAINHFYNNPFDQRQLLMMMGELEGQISGSVHYDNVAPAYLGGMVLMTGEADQATVSLPVFNNWYWVLCYSGLSVSTSAARKILPDQYPISDTLRFGRQLAVFVDALYRNDPDTAARMIKDPIAEPYRKALLPKFDEAAAFVDSQSGLAFGISGSGPTVFAVTDDLDCANRIQQWLQEHYVQNAFGFSHVCKIDKQGAKVD